MIFALVILLHVTCINCMTVGVEAVFGSVVKAGAKKVKLEIDEVGPMGSDTAVTTLSTSK